MEDVSFGADTLYFRGNWRGGTFCVKAGIGKVEIFDTYEQIAHYFPHQEFSISNWEQYAGYISHALVDLVKDDIKDYNFEKDILPVVKNALANHEKQFYL